MSLFAKWSAALQARDAEGLNACLHEDYTFIRHQSGTSMNKTEMSEMMRNFMSSDSVVVHSQRCLYENDEVMVEHSLMSFPDGSSEAIITFNRLKDGLIVQSETGATPIKS